MLKISMINYALKYFIKMKNIVNLFCCFFIIVFFLIVSVMFLIVYINITVASSTLLNQILQSYNAFFCPEDKN